MAGPARWAYGKGTGRPLHVAPRRGRWRLIAAMAGALVLFVAAVALASDADVSVADVTAPTDAVELEPGQSENITITIEVTGRQEGTATFKVYRDWTLNGGVFTGSNPQTFTVDPRVPADPADVYNANGTVTVAAGHAPGGPHTLEVDIFDVTNSNATGAKLDDSARTVGTYDVTVLEPSGPPACEDEYTVTFKRPVDEFNATGKVNSINSKQVAPIKVDVYDDCEEEFITDPNAVITIKASLQNGNGGGETDPINDFASAGSANTDNLFRWSDDCGCWIYNLSMKGLGLTVSNTYRIDVYVGNALASDDEYALLKVVK